MKLDISTQEFKTVILKQNDDISNCKCHKNLI